MCNHILKREYKKRHSENFISSKEERTKQKKEKERNEFIKKALSINLDKYSYNKSECYYVDGMEKIWCNKCQIYFEQRRTDHLRGHGHYACGRIKGSKNKKQAKKGNSILDKIPEIARYWDFEKNEKLPSEVNFGTHDRFFLKCNDCDGSYSVVLKNKKNSKHTFLCEKCAIAQPHTPSEGQSVAELHNDLLNWFDIDKNKNINLTNFKIGSNKKINWLCPIFKHSFSRRIFNQINLKSCPVCNSMIQKSQIELLILFELKYFFPNIEPFDYIVKIKNKKYKCDIFISEKNTIIEYDGSRWHKSKIETDKIKTEILKNEGYEVIRIRENPLNQIFDNDILTQKYTESTKNVHIKKIVSEILQKLNIDKEYIFNYNKEEELFGIDECNNFNNSLEKFGILSEQKIELLKKLYIKDNLKFEEVCEQMQISKFDFFKNTKHYNIKKYIKGSLSANYKCINEKELETLCNSGKNQNEIAKHFNVSKETIKDRVQKCGFYIKRYKTKLIIQKDLYNKKIAQFNSVIEASKMTGLRKENIATSARSSGIKKCGNFLWEYV